MIRCSSVGVSGSKRATGGGSRSRIAASTSVLLEAAKGERPATDSYSITPSDHMSQKRVDVLAHALDTVLAWDVQMVVMGSGDPEAEAFFLSRARTRGDRLCAWIPFDDARSHRIQAAADLFVMPSRVPRGRPGRQRAQLRPGEASHRLERRPAPFDADGVTIATCPRRTWSSAAERARHPTSELLGAPVTRRARSSIRGPST